MRRTIILGASILCLVQAAVGTDYPLSVCEALSNLDHYRGRLVTIRGVLLGGSRHGWFLQESTSDRPCPGFDQAGRRWPPALSVVEFTKGSEIEDGPTDFESDATQIRGMLSEPQRIVGNRADLAIAVTLIGKLRSRKGVHVQRAEDGWYFGDGYGQGGQFPAQLVLKTVKDAKVIKREQGDQR